MTAQPETELLVIGGGSTGAGVAWDAARRGLQVTLVDRGDLASGATGHFHGLLHSGGRYVVTDPDSARECASENRILRRIAADYIEDTGGLFLTTPIDDPAYADRFLAGCAVTGVTVKEVPVSEALRREPLLNPKITRAFAVDDAAIDAWKTVWACARGATAYGARILPYHEVLNLRVEGDAVVGATLRHSVSGAEVEIRAQCTVNAVGAWAGQLAKMAGCHLGVVPGKGVLVAMNNRLVNTVVNRCNVPGDGDIIVPVRTACVIGTTDVPIDDPDQIAPTAAEVVQLMAAGEALIPGFSGAQVLRSWAGARPLFPKGDVAGQVQHTRYVTRSHAVIRHGQTDGVARLITITGGKFTTFRLMAQDAVDAVCAELDLEATTCTTAEVPLPDSEEHRFNQPPSRCSQS
ncbi:MAG: FAD-dependent oxidoreductase [Candidatus Dormiibacterota bacterium]